MAKTTAKNFFQSFTNLYELSKTLRFELKPVGETKKMLKKTNLQGKTPIQVDREIDELYHQEMKPMFDKLHEKFINESLGKVNFKVSDLKKLESLYLELRRLKKEFKVLRSNKDDKNESKIKGIEARINEIEGYNKNIGEIKQIQKELRENIIGKFNKTAKKWKKDLNGIETELYNKNGKKKIKIDIKKETSEFLKEDNVLAILAYFNPKKIDQIKKFSGFFTYFSGFNQNRENYYSTDDKTTGVANRIVNENFVKFVENKRSFEQILEKVQSLAEYKKYFELENYQNCITQEKIDEVNEDIIGKINLEKNLFCQQENSKAKDKNKKIFLPNLEKLQKQIGCRNKQQREQEKSGESIYPKYLEKVGLGFQITKNTKGKYQIWECLDYLNKELEPWLKKVKLNYEQFFKNWQKDNYKLDEIWFRKESINTISGKWFGGDNWYILSNVLSYLGTGKTEKGEYKIPSFVNLLELKEALDILGSGIDFDIKKSRKKSKKEQTETNNEKLEKFSYSPENLFKEEFKKYYRETLFETFLAIWQGEIDFKFTQIFDGYKIKDENEKEKFIPAFLKEFEKESQEFFDQNKKVNEKSIHTEIVKNLIEEGYLRLFQLTKYHNLKKKGEIVAFPIENRFYDTLNKFWEDNQIVIYHKALQATLTKKSYSEDKIKLNFENGSLLGGFSDGQEKNKSGVILQNDNKFFLGILKNRGFFRTDKPNPLYQRKDSNWHRLILTNLKFQTLAGKGFLGKYEKSYGDLGKTDPMKAVGLLKEFIKTNYIKKYPQLESVAIGNYKNKKDFDTEIKKALNKCFTMKFVPIKQEVLQQGLKQDDLYLFEITNKDFSQFSKGKNKSIHTLYWQELFGNENLKKPIFALNGGAEVFFRRGQKDKLDKKVDKSGKEVLNGKRYSEDKYFLHVSVTINYGKPKIIKFKQLVNEVIKKEKNDIRIIGIDRGEKNLLYYSVINSSGKIIEQKSLNRIELDALVDEKEVKAKYENGKIKSAEFVNTGKKVNYTDYQVLLDYYEKKRDLARKSWQVVGKIKDLKEGYLSQTIHKIYQLVAKHNAIVVMEDLNSEFKAKRAAKVEKSIYKKFELALARKFNHLILKDKKVDEFGGVLNAYQLTPYIKPGDMSKFEKAKQWGILFYVRANYTSTTDPLTGWRKHKYISNSETIPKIRIFFNPDTGIQINYDQDNKCFRFSYKNEGSLWKLLAFNGLQRFRWNNEKRKMETYDLYEKFEELFVGLDKSKNINQQIESKDNFKWKNLVFWWNLLNQIRNSDKEKQGNENDFLQSPVWSEKYRCFYDSRKVDGNNIPNNGDANGAYNIARKGAMLLERIKKCQDIRNFGNDNNGKNPENSYYISDKEWDKFVQQK